MKAVVLCIVVLPLIILACDSNDERPDSIEGTYSGYFRRTSPFADSDLAHITLTLSDGTYSGTSDKVKYPAICNGTYTLRGDEIEFKNACVWTAEFDWTFILDGEYTIASEGNELLLTRTYTENIFDQYVLTKQ